MVGKNERERTGGSGRGAGPGAMAPGAMAPPRFDDPDALVESILSRVGRRVVLGTPLGIGKSVPLVDAFYRRAEADRSLDLTIHTALTLMRPRPGSELERRLAGPIVERIFADAPEPLYAAALAEGRLPDNVRVQEFYLLPGRWLAVPAAQRGHVSANYTHVARDLLDAGLNVLVQMVSPATVDGQERWSLSSNPDLTLDLLPHLIERRRHHGGVAVVAHLNPRLPFMPGDAALEPEVFDAALAGSAWEHALFAPPNDPVSTVDHAIALHVAPLVRDGGTLQLGIGSLGDAVTYALSLRQRSPERFRRVLGDLGVIDADGSGASGFGASGPWAGLIARLGGLEPFRQGVYAPTEMLVDGFLDLARCGVLARRVYDHPGIQRLVAAGRLGERPDRAGLEALVEEGVVGPVLDPAGLELLRRFGVLRPEVTLEDDGEDDGNGGRGARLRLADGRTVAPDLTEAATLDALEVAGLGEELLGGVLAHAAFFLGPRAFYQSLREMSLEERSRFAMTRVSFVNQLYSAGHGDEELKVLQRPEARFVNSGLIATLDGAVASDALEDGRTLSGVGGQYNFVAMAHALDDGRSILMIRSVRESGGEVTSNLRWSYGHCTIPRHLRDLVITEYGIADLRGQPAGRVAAALIAVADSRFQDELIEEGRERGILAADFRLPERHRHNTPERLEEALASHRAEGLFGEYPFGTDLTEIEVVLAGALKRLSRAMDTRDLSVLPSFEELKKTLDAPEAAQPYLERMGLADPSGLEERLLRRAVLFALARDGAI